MVRLFITGTNPRTERGRGRVPSLGLFFFFFFLLIIKLLLCLKVQKTHAALAMEIKNL